MSKEYLCTGCYRTSGTDGESNYCSECQTYKYFDWVEREAEEEPHRQQHQCNADLPTRYALRQEGRQLEREHIVKLIERNICFDALADENGRCGNHGGKCYELRLLINSLIEGETNG